MLYQLPNGKTIYMSLEEYLDLTEADIQYLVAANCGDSILNPFTGSAVEKNSKEKKYDFDYLPDDEKEDDEPDFNGLDYLEE
jgi:hypothetical protein